jgi:transcriptional regulator with XRE-family HTH domain
MEDKPLRHLRKSKRLTLRAVSQATDLDPSAICAYEAGRYDNPTLDTMRRLSAVYDVSLEHLAGLFAATTTDARG